LFFDSTNRFSSSLDTRRTCLKAARRGYCRISRSSRKENKQLRRAVERKIDKTQISSNAQEDISREKAINIC